VSETASVVGAGCTTINYIVDSRRAKIHGGGKGSMSNALAVTDTTFEDEIEKHEGLAVVDFWATWCGPCRAIAPMLDQLAVEYEGKAKVAKLDVDANQKTAMRFNVRSIPTILFFKNGKLVDTVIGAVPKPRLAEKFQNYAISETASVKQG
jgi:thioredoxin 1